MQYFWVGLGGCLGAIARYTAGRLVSGSSFFAAYSFPWATLVVNVLGSFAIGLLAVLLMHRSAGSEELRLLLIVGFLGSFTTFSAFSLETLTLLNDGVWLRAVLNILANVLLCLIAVVLGYTAARQLALS